MKTYLGNYLGLVVDDRDPQNRGRVKIFIPHIMPTLYEGWNKEGKDISINITDSSLPTGLDVDTLNHLQKILPWAECAAPVFGAGPSGRLNYQDGTLNQKIGNVGKGNYEGLKKQGASSGEMGNATAGTVPGGGTPGNFSYVPTSINKGRVGFGPYEDDYQAINLKTSGGMYFSLHNDAAGNNDNYNPSIVIPTDASIALQTQARAYVNEVAAHMNASGEFNVTGRVLVNGKYGRQPVDNNVTFLETINVKSQKQIDFWYNSPDNLNEHADIIARTLGQVPGAVFGLPHNGLGGKGGAASNGGQSEEDLAAILYPYLQVRAAGTYDPYNPAAPLGSVASDENPSAEPFINEGINDDQPDKDPISVQDGGTQGINFGGGTATRFGENETGIAATRDPIQGSAGRLDDDYTIGIFTHYLKQLPQEWVTKLTPEQQSRLTDSGEPLGKYTDVGLGAPLYATFNYNGQTIGVKVVDYGTGGVTTGENSAKAPYIGNDKNQVRVFDIASAGKLDELLAKLGAPGPNSAQNISGITNFTVRGPYTRQQTGQLSQDIALAEGVKASRISTPSGATAPAESTTVAEAASQPVVQAPNQYPTVGGRNTNYMPTGMFGGARAGQTVWVFFQEGNPLFPVYFAASYSEKEWSNVSQGSSNPPTKNELDIYQNAEQVASFDGGGFASQQIISGQASGFENDEFVFQIFGKNGSALTFTALATILASKYDFRQHTQADAHYITGGNREDRTVGNHNVVCEQDLIFTVGNWTQEALDAAAEIQQAINEAMKAAKDTYEA